MDYQNTLTYLYNSVPMFQQVGGSAYKEGLENTRILDEHFGHPHRSFRTIHVAGTNGKGSCSHTLAAILQEAGYRVGLYTSPHLVDFRERIRINGSPIPEEYVVHFVEKERDFFEPLHPSFFELTTAMAFRYFADEKVDVAIIEVGLGGRLDCTNIIHPDLCIITNISFDHTQFLGDTLAKIAGEKAGIIKPGIPVVIGETTHTLAAILQEAGYRVGLYTSPHLVDFRERIRINGSPIPEEYVVHFVEKERDFFEPLHPSFFELTTAMAFRYFADEKVDVAIIEVGLGGRLDCTNIIHPDLCIITNISFDHTQFLGDTLAKIAGEKAGIIKPGIPVVIGETTPETKLVFLQKAAAEKAPVVFAEERMNNDYPGLKTELQGLYQLKNTRTILTALPLLKEAGYRIDERSVRSGFARVCELTGLMGRWQKLQESPTLICDTGHNVGGITYIVEQLKQQTYRQLHIIIGMVNDKDISGVLALLPKDAVYYFTKASVKRALPEEELCRLAAQAGLQGNCYPDVPAAVTAAQEKSHPEDFIFVGGSSFIVADLLANRDALNLH